MSDGTWHSDHSGVGVLGAGVRIRAWGGPDSRAADGGDGGWGMDVAGMDRSVRPGDDFFAFASGVWAKTAAIPSDRARWGAFDQLRELSERRVRAMLEGQAFAPAADPVSLADRAKVLGLFASYMDEATVERLGWAPVAGKLAEIRGLDTHEAVARRMGASRGGFGGSFFGVGVGDDSKNPDWHTVYLRQSGLGLPDREYDLAERFAEQKARYREYVAAVLTAGGWADAETAAADAERIVAMETAMAGVHWARADSRDRNRTYNAMTLAQLSAEAPGFAWELFFEAAGLDMGRTQAAGEPGKLVVSQRSAVAGLAEVFSRADLPTLRAYLAFHTLDDAAPLLHRAASELRFEFRTKYLSGVPEQRERVLRAVSFVEGTMGEAVGREYVALYFSPEAKSEMEVMVGDLRAAMAGRIRGLTWMSDATKAAALEKLGKFNVKIGYPGKWRDYSALEVRVDDLFGNAERGRRFAWDIQRKRLGTRVDKTEWGMTPQTVNAYYSSTRNEIVFPAAILQPPFFDLEGDVAVNYGAIGGVIGHEITHGFDDQGRKSDGDGVLRDWWTTEDAIRFESEARKLGAQYEAYEFSEHPGLRLTARLTMGENIADLGGVLLAVDA